MASMDDIAARLERIEAMLLSLLTGQQTGLPATEMTVDQEAAVAAIRGQTIREYLADRARRGKTRCKS